MAIHRIQQEDTTESSSPSEEEDFGAFIERVRRRSRIQIQEIAAQFPLYLEKWNRFTYSHLVGERKRTPLFEELLPLYQALVISGVHFSVAERNQFLALARLKVEHRSPGKGVIHPTEQQWRSLHAAWQNLTRCRSLRQAIGVLPEQRLHSPYLRFKKTGGTWLAGTTGSRKCGHTCTFLCPKN
jgi:hypothetical protein